jgi:hypothetical protein
MVPAALRRIIAALLVAFAVAASQPVAFARSTERPFVPAAIKPTPAGESGAWTWLANVAESVRCVVGWGSVCWMSAVPPRPLSNGCGVDSNGNPIPCSIRISGGGSHGPKPHPSNGCGVDPNGNTIPCPP